MHSYRDIEFTASRSHGHGKRQRHTSSLRLFLPDIPISKVGYPARRSRLSGLPKPAIRLCRPRYPRTRGPIARFGKSDI